MEVIKLITDVMLTVVLVNTGLWAMMKLFQSIDWLTGQDDE